jgi:hypothetical protein
MLSEEAEALHRKDDSQHRVKSKFNISKAVKRRAVGALPQGQVAFNDPLYEYLDNEVLNKEQHNFGPWIEHERLKSREKHNAQRNLQSELPLIYRPQDTTSRYYQEQEALAL